MSIFEIKPIFPPSFPVFRSLNPHLFLCVLLAVNLELALFFLECNKYFSFTLNVYNFGLLAGQHNLPLSKCYPVHLLSTCRLWFH